MEARQVGGPFKGSPKGTSQTSSSGGSAGASKADRHLLAGTGAAAATLYLVGLM
jgi:hypothetical protein